MSNLDKAKDLYLRGFGNDVLKSETGISLQSFLKTMRSKGYKYSKKDVIAHQIEYISTNYDLESIIDAYSYIQTNFKNPYESGKSKEIFVLDCQFGEYAKVFKSLLGSGKYSELRNKFWKSKQVKTIQSIYGVDNVFDASVFPFIVDEDRIVAGRQKRTQTLISRYGVEHPNQYPEFKEKMMDSYRETMLRIYGVEYALQNKESALKARDSRQKTMLERYGVKNTVESPILRSKIFESRALNGTLNTSTSEEKLYLLLCEVFGESDVYRNIVIDGRYPFHVDFYIKSRDLFIELNGDACHGDHWFDPSNDLDLVKVNKWFSKFLETKSPRYFNFIKTWTRRDLLKRAYAKKFRLNYLVFWDSTRHMENGLYVPNLSDAMFWFESGCPDSRDWASCNTY